MDTITVYDAVSFIRRYNLLSKWTDEQIAGAINKALATNSLAFEIDHENKLKAFCLGQWTKDNVLHVIAFAGPGRMKVMLDHLKFHFPLCNTITCERYGQFRSFSLNKIARHFK